MNIRHRTLSMANTSCNRLVEKQRAKELKGKKEYPCVSMFYKKCFFKKNYIHMQIHTFWGIGSMMIF